MACVKLCWVPTPRGIFCKREKGPVVHVITFVDELAIQVPSIDAWDQFIWPPAAAMPQALTEVELYGYCHSQVVDLGPVMPVVQFRVSDEAGTYLCVAWALVFRGASWHITPPRMKQSGFPHVTSPMI